MPDDKLTIRYRKACVLGSCRGFDAGQVSETLRGITVGDDGRIYVVGDSRLMILSRDDKLLRSVATERPGHAVFVSPDGKVYVGEEGQIQVFDREGRLLGTWRDEKRLGLVSSIAMTKEAILVADRKARCIRHFKSDRTYVRDIGADNRQKGFVLHAAILDFVVDAKDVIHAANPGKHRIEHYSLEGKLTGRFGRFDGRDPAGFTGCCNPTNIALTPAGEIVTVEKAPPRVKVYSLDGRLRAVLGEGDFDLSCRNSDVAVDRDGRLYVIDTVRLHIVVYEPLAAAPSSQPAAEVTK